MADAGHVAWDMERFKFLDRRKRSSTAFTPRCSASRSLNNNYGLYEVIPGIYQVRGFDLSDISFVRGKTGLDCLRSAWCSGRRLAPHGSCSSSTSARACQSLP